MADTAIFIVVQSIALYHRDARTVLPIRRRRTRPMKRTAVIRAEWTIVDFFNTRAFHPLAILRRFTTLRGWQFSDKKKKKKKNTCPNRCCLFDLNKSTLQLVHALTSIIYAFVSAICYDLLKTNEKSHLCMRPSKLIRQWHMCYQPPYSMRLALSLACISRRTRLVTYAKFIEGCIAVSSALRVYTCLVCTQGKPALACTFFLFIPSSTWHRRRDREKHDESFG